MRCLFSFLFIFSLNITAQDILTDTVYKKGIYRTFQEFRTNSPSLELSYEVKEMECQYGGNYLNMGDWYNYQLPVTAEESLKVGNIFGFCDGKHLYIITNGLTKRMYNNRFEKIQFLGAEYSFYQRLSYWGGTPTVTTTAGPFFGTGSSSKLEECVINMATGEIIVLNNKRFKKFIADNPVLLQRYKDDPKREFRRKKYLLEYLEEKK